MEVDTAASLRGAKEAEAREGSAKDEDRGVGERVGESAAQGVDGASRQVDKDGA